MNLASDLYGKQPLEPVLKELIETDAIQRLKMVHQNGACYLVNPLWNNTRYDHSIGVMLLIRKMGGSIEEQMAGLLHDVSHTAFSHVIDQVLKQENEDYHEQIKDVIVKKSEIPDVIHKHGYDLEPLLNETNWPILEQPTPHLCADRIDYTLLDMYRYGEITKREVEGFLESLMINDGKIVLTDIHWAEWFVEVYYKEVIDFFLHPLNIYSNHVLTNVLHIALEKKKINREDFMKTDAALLEKISDLNDEDIEKERNKLEDRIKVLEDQDDYQLEGKKKLRLIDPEVHVGSRVFPASTLSDKVKAMNEQAEQRSLKGAKIKVIHY